MVFFWLLKFSVSVSSIVQLLVLVSEIVQIFGLGLIHNSNFWSWSQALFKSIFTSLTSFIRKLRLRPLLADMGKLCDKKSFKVSGFVLAFFKSTFLLIFKYTEGVFFLKTICVEAQSG